ncbi:MAG TPA: hypothetical protein VIY69_18895 [Candidatus Acidoferrales bacterium]
MQFNSKCSAIAADDIGIKSRVRASDAMRNEETVYACERASELLFQIQDETTGLLLNAEILRALTKESEARRESHVSYLGEINAHINEVWNRAFDLHRISSHTLPWQQDAIGQLTAHASEVAASTQAAIDCLCDVSDGERQPEYKSQVTALADASQRIAQTMSGFFDRYMAHQKLRRETALVIATE